MKAIHQGWGIPRSVLALPFGLLGVGVGLGIAHAQTTEPEGTLAPVVISASRYAQPLQSLPQGVSVITATQIQQLGAKTIPEAISRGLGEPMRQDSYGGGEYQLDLRGFGEARSSNTVVVVDGVKLNDDEDFSPRLASIPIESVERIEVLRGSAAVLYGEGAVGGVVMIVTKAGSGRKSKNQGSVTFGVGSHALRELQGQVTRVHEGLALNAAASLRKSNNHRENFASTVKTGQIGLSWSGDAVRLGVQHTADSLDGRMPGELTYAQFEADPTQTQKPNDWVTLKQQRTRLYGQWNLGDWQIHAEHGVRQRNLNSAITFWGALSPYEANLHAHQTQLRTQWQTKVGEGKNTLQLGLERTSWDRTTVSSFGSSEANRKSRAFFIQDSLHLPQGIQLQAGWRQETLDKASSSTSLKDRLQAWDLGGSYALSGEQTLWARLSTAYRLAHADEYTYTNPNIALQPQTSKDVEMGWRWASQAVKAEVRAFSSRSKDEIRLDPVTYQNINMDPIQRRGLALDVDVPMNANWQWGVKAISRTAKFQSGVYEDQAVPLVPNQTVALQTQYQWGEGHRVGGGVQWQSTQEAAYQGTCKIPAVTTAYTHYTWTHKAFEARFGIQNLFDRKYFATAYGCDTTNTNQPTSLYPEPGRTWSASIRYAF